HFFNPSIPTSITTCSLHDALPICTGKGLVAQALHSLSPRAVKSMMTVNMGGLSETLFESELFGHVKGAFTDAKTDRAGRFELAEDRKSTRLNSSHQIISYDVVCLK